MKIAIPLDENRQDVCIVLARAPYFLFREDGMDTVLENPAAQAQSGAGIQAAQFLVEQGQITYFHLQFRSYTDTGNTSVVLPERQAAAAMEAMGHTGEELLLVYLDNGNDELVSASWAATGELAGGR